MVMSQQITTYIQLQVKNRDRVTVFFRAILIIPMAILAGSFSGYSPSNSYIAGIFVIPVVLTLLFRGVYPSYALQFNKAIVALSVRITAYFLLLTDDYPSIEANEKVGVEFPDIQEGRALSRGLPLIKWFLAIPLYIVGIVYAIYALILTLIAWFTIVFTGEYPDWCAHGVVGTVAYWNRVYGYAFILVTDEYPSISL
jgi:hypothetical protein